jgi:hypothetical protein
MRKIDQIWCFVLQRYPKNEREASSYNLAMMDFM